MNNILNYTCDGYYIGFQPKIYSYKISNFQLVKKVSISMHGSADDYGQLIVNDSLTLKGTQGTANVEYVTPITLTSENVTIKVGANNTAPSACYFYGGFDLKFYYSDQYMFTESIKTTTVSLNKTSGSNAIPIDEFAMVDAVTYGGGPHGTGYSLVTIKGLPNTTYTYLFTTNSSTIDGGLAYLTPSYTRVLESTSYYGVTNGGVICTSVSPVGTDVLDL